MTYRELLREIMKASEGFGGQAGGDIRAAGGAIGVGLAAVARAIALAAHLRYVQDNGASEAEKDVADRDVRQLAGL